MRALAIVLILCAAISACAGTDTRFTTTIVTASGDLPLPVSLHDDTGLVVSIGPAMVETGPFRDAGVLADPADPNAFVLTWLGGMCDNDVGLIFRSTGAGHDVRIEIHEKLGFGCPAAGVLRAVRVATSGPLAIGTISVSGSKSIELVREDSCGPLEDAATNDAKVACGVLITATVGEDPARFARVTVRPDDGACPGTECATNAGIEAQAWRVDAADRTGDTHSWQCTYRAEQAACYVVAQPSAS